MNKSDIEVSIVRAGQHNDTVALKEYGHEGRVYVEAKLDNEYSIKVKNNAPHRALIVASVDGLSVLTGEPASTKDGGYVVNGYSSIVIRGFRKSNDEVGAFKFTTKERGYATEKGGSANVGVIAVAAFREKVAPAPEIIYRDRFIDRPYPVPSWPTPWNQPYWLGGATWTCQAGGTTTNANGIGDNVTYAMNCSNNASLKSPISAMACSAGAAQQSVAQPVEPFQAATSWGTKLEDKVKDVTFERDSDTPFAVLEILYAFKEGLKELGVQVTSEKSVAFPSAFPKSFATPPSGWTGRE